MSLKDKMIKLGNYLVPPKTQDQIDYEKKLKAETDKARRDSYLKEAIKQSHLKGRQQAIKNYHAPDKMNQLTNFAGNLEKNLSGGGIGKKDSLKKKMKAENSDAFNKLLFG